MSQALVNQIIMIALLVAVGYAANKAGVLGDQTQRALSNIVINITIPAMILSSANMPYDPDTLDTILWILGGAIVYFPLAALLCTFLAKLLKLPQKRGATFICLIVFANVAFIGYPVIVTFLPEKGIFLTSFFVAVFNIVQFTYAQRLISNQKGSLRSILTNMPTIAAVLMLIFYIAQIKLPGALQNTLNTLGNMSTPLSILTIGSMLAGIRLREVFTTPLSWFITVMRLILIPTAIFAVLKLLPVPLESATVLLLVSALPSANTTALFALKYDSDYPLATQAILQSILLFMGSVFYVSFLISLL
jgi:predicted permease